MIAVSLLNDYSVMPNESLPHYGSRLPHYGSPNSMSSSLGSIWRAFVVSTLWLRSRKGYGLSSPGNTKVFTTNGGNTKVFTTNGGNTKVFTTNGGNTKVFTTNGDIMTM